MTIATPCIKVCKLDNGVCVGCGRTQEELRMWTTYSDQERENIIKKVRKLRHL